MTCLAFRHSRCAFRVLAVLVLWLGSARAADEVFTPAHVAKLRNVSAIAVAPDGQHIAYSLSVPRRPMVDSDGPAWTELHVVDREGRSRPFVTGEVSVSGVSWSPDGRAISFLAKRGEDKHVALYTIPLEGGEARKVLEHGEDLRAFAWSPDGRRLAFLAVESDSDVVKKQREKGFTQQVYEEDWKPVRLWLARPGEEGATPSKVELEGSASELSWSPDGSKLALALAPTPGVDDDYMRRRVHILDAADGRVLGRLDNVGKLGAVSWSPDGQNLALIAAADLNDPAPGRLLIGPASGGPLQDLQPLNRGHITDVVWKDAETVVYLADEGVYCRLGTIRRDRTEAKVLIPKAAEKVFTAIELARDGTALALVGETDRHPSEVFAAELGERVEPRKLTENNPWLAGLRFARQEATSFRARDGLALEGVLIHPLEAGAQERAGAGAQERAPLIVSVHGGPESIERAGWLTNYSKPGQVAAARGFAVFYPNYRGSTGYGVEFSKMGQGDPAGKEFDDLVDAVDYLVTQAQVERARVGITGGSYGGYASAWGATYYSDRFAAAVMFVGISDVAAKTGTTDIPEEEFLVHARRRPWEDWSSFLDRSPIKYVEQAHTPLLILHGKDDPRVHPSQSLELYRFLKIAGKAPVRLVWYPGEGHGNRRAASRYDYHVRMLEWFDHYLKGPGGEPPNRAIDYGLEGGGR